MGVVEPLSIDFTGTCELALWCKLLRDRGWTGPQIARSLGRSEGYINNLVRILERASLAVLLRWKAEQQRGSLLAPVCATDWLMQVCVLPREQQDDELAHRIAKREPRQKIAASAKHERTLGEANPSTGEPTAAG